MISYTSSPPDPPSRVCPNTLFTYSYNIHVHTYHVHRVFNIYFFSLPFSFSKIRSFYNITCESESPSVVSDSLRSHGLYSPRNSPGQNTGVSSHSLLQWIFPTQELNQGLLNCRQILYQLSYQGSPTLLVTCDTTCDLLFIYLLKFCLSWPLSKTDTYETTHSIYIVEIIFQNRGVQLYFQPVFLFDGGDFQFFHLQTQCYNENVETCAFSTAAFKLLTKQIPRIVISGSKDVCIFKFNVAKPDTNGQILYNILLI